MESKSDGKGGGSTLLGHIAPESQLTLRYQAICAYVSTNYDSPSLMARARKLAGKETSEEHAQAQERQILHHVSGVLYPGEILALMGPSGSGKTSLLSVISGRAPRAVRTTGKVTVNGEHFSKAQKRRVGFVLQDDLLYETLTVWETLSFAAALRLPRAMTAAQRHERVEAVITELGLNKCRDTIIGGFFRRGISGGERKRVSIGHELLINPALMMLDEPTSGLDATTALHLLTTLRGLASGGRAICTTIHQPSSRLYQQLDKLMLLAEGHVVYYGGAQQTVSWFSALGFAMPYGVNVADFLLDLAQGEVSGTGVPLPDAAALPHELPGSNGKLPTIAAAEAAPAAAASAGSKSVAVTAKGMTASAAGGGVLSGPAAIRALYSSYEHYQQRHKQGFMDTATISELQLMLEPPVHKAEPKKSSSALAGAGGSVVDSFRRAGSWLGLSKAALDKPPAAAGDGDNLDMSFEDDPELGRGISRAYSKSFSVVGGGGSPTAAAAAGGKPKKRGLVAWLGLADRGGASYFTQIQVLVMRGIKVRRFESLSGQRFAQLVVVAILTGLFWFQRGQGNTLLAASDVVGLLFFELLFPSFSTMFTALFTFPSEYRMLLKERASGMYRISAYYLASAAGDLPMDCAFPMLFVIIIYFMGGLRLSAAAFLANVFSMVLVVLVAQSLGLLLGVSFMNPKTSQTVAAIIMLSFMLVGGYYVRGIPVWIAWVKYLSFIYWGFNLLIKVEFAGLTYYACGDLLTGQAQTSATGGAAPGTRVSADTPGCAPVPDLQRAMQLPVDVNESPLLDGMVLLAMLVGARIWIYFTLRKKTKAS